MVGNATPSPSRSGARALTVGCLAALLSVSSGCALLRRVSFEVPTVELAAVRIAALDLSGGVLEVLLNLRNPNPYGVSGRQLEGEVLLEGLRFGSVTREAAWTLPADADTTLALRLAFGWSAVGAAARSLLERQAVSYSLAGRVLVSTLVDERWVEISHRGEVPLERMRP
jgi:LEA14-like dessication related protein